MGTGGFSTPLASSPAGTALPCLSQSVVPGAPGAPRAAAVRIQRVKARSAIPRLLGSSPSQLPGNLLLGQELSSSSAVLAGSRHKQAQTLLLDPGNCCLRDRFAYKYPSFSRWLFKAGKEKGSLLAQNLPAPALGASPHLSSSFQPPQVPAVGMRHSPQVSAGWRIPAVSVTLQLSLLPAQPPLQPAGR